MKRGYAIENTWAGFPEWPGDTIRTLSPSGLGKLIACLKCEACGHSVQRHEDDIQGTTDHVQ